jgi:hypothetical protein
MMIRSENIMQLRSRISWSVSLGGEFGQGLFVKNGM